VVVSNKGFYGKKDFMERKVLWKEIFYAQQYYGVARHGGVCSILAMVGVAAGSFGRVLVLVGFGTARLPDGPHSQYVGRAYTYFYIS
jgi:hypothetical protein